MAQGLNYHGGGASFAGYRSELLSLSGGFIQWRQSVVSRNDAAIGERMNDMGRDPRNHQPSRGRQSIEQEVVRRSEGLLVCQYRE